MVFCCAAFDAAGLTACDCAAGICAHAAAADSGNAINARTNLQWTRGFIASLKALGRPLVAEDGFDGVRIFYRQARTRR